MQQMPFLPGRSRLRCAFVALATLAMTLGACATPPTDPAAREEFDRTNDPFEPLNRQIFDFNLFLDRTVIKPVAQGYRAAVPEPGRDSIRHFFDNLGEPIIFANNLLQGQFKRAHDTFARFLMNSTFGLAGILDLATKEGLERQSGDFGQTLYTWGVPDGPYLVLPLFGPSNPRDAVGMGVDAAADPYALAFSSTAMTEANLGRAVLSGIDERSRNIETLDELQKNAIDFYAELRSLYRQHRASELRHGEPAAIPGLDTDEQ